MDLTGVLFAVVNDCAGERAGGVAIWPPVGPARRRACDPVAIARRWVVRGAVLGWLYPAGHSKRVIGNNW